MTTMELEKFGGERLASSTPVFESIFLYWFVYFALLGFAYCTNPSDLTFRRFLTDLSIQDHLRHFTYPPSTNDSSTLTFDHKISISLCTPAYQRRDFFIGSLVCVSGREAEVVEEEEDWWTRNGQWFLGAFGSWWILDRRYAADWVRSLWRRWRRKESSQTSKGDDRDQNFVIRPLSSSESSQRKAAGSSKKKRRGRKKSPGHGIDASPIIIGRCTTPARADHPELDHTEPDGLSYSSFSTGSDRDSLSSEVSGSSPHWANRDLKEQLHPAGHLGQLTTASHRVTYSCEETTGFVKLSGAGAGLPILSMGRNQEIQCRKGRKTKKIHAESMMTTRKRTTTVEIAHSTSDLSAEDDSVAKNVGERSRKSVEVRSELEKESSLELNTIKLKKKEDDLNKLNFQSSLKHLNEELADFKRLDLNQKLSHVKLTHNNLVVKSQSFKKELEALHVKEGVVNLTFAQNLELVKKEKERMEIGLKKNGQEFEALSKNFEVKKAQKTSVQQRLNTRKVESRAKKEPSTSPNSASSKKFAKAGSSSNRSSTSDLATVVPSPPQSSPSTPAAVALKDENSPDAKSRKPARSICQAASPPFDHPRPLTYLNLKSDRRPLSLSDPREPNPRPDQSRDPWREEVEDELGVHFKTSLPSLDSSHSLWHPIAPPPPRSTPDFFDYRHQLLQTQVGLDQPQQASPFGAIGQQGGSPPTISRKISPIQSASVFEPKALFEAFAPVSENEVHRRKLTTSLGSSPSIARPACRLERLRENQGGGGGWLAVRSSVENNGGAIGVLGAPDPFISPIGDLASFSDSVRTSNRHTIGSPFPVEQRTIGLKRSTERIESRVNVRRHQTSQSVGVIGIGSKGLSSVFDGVVPERSTAIKKFDQHPALSLNPSAKAFKFGGRKEEQEFEETDVVEDGLLGAVKEEEETSEGGSRKRGVGKLEEEDESWTRSLAALRAGVVGSTNPTTTMTTLLSPGEALPAACTKSAWAGLFGPIGAVRSEARVDDEWRMGRERVALFNRGT